MINGYLTGTTREDGTISAEQYEQLLSRLSTVENALQVTAGKNTELEKELQTTKTALDNLHVGETQVYDNDWTTVRITKIYGIK